MGTHKKIKSRYFSSNKGLSSFGCPKLNNGLALQPTLLNKGPGKERSCSSLSITCAVYLSRLLVLCSNNYSLNTFLQLSFCVSILKLT